jgi:hypothetical protein
MVLVVNAFTRISGPAIFDNPPLQAWLGGKIRVCLFISMLRYTGHQFDFDRSSPWLHDDSPGWGASHADMEEMILQRQFIRFSSNTWRCYSRCGLFIRLRFAKSVGRKQGDCS